MSNIIRPAIYQQVDDRYQESIHQINLAFGRAANHENKAVSERAAAGRQLNLLRSKVEQDGHDWWRWYALAGFVRGRKDAERIMRQTAEAATDEEAEEAVNEARERDAERKRSSRAEKTEQKQSENGADVCANESVATENSDDVVAQAIALIQRMTPEERRSFVAQTKEILPWDDE